MSEETTVKYWKKGSEVRTTDCFDEETPEDLGFDEVTLEHLDGEQTVLYGDGTWMTVNEIKRENAEPEQESA